MWTILVKLILLIYINNHLDTAFCISCGSEWETYNASCYQYFSDSKTWENARAFCIALGADLAVVKDENENTFIDSISSSDVWIGLRDIEEENVWVWIESGECSDYTNFNNGEPNDAGNEDCVELETSGRWNDLKCSTKQGYVCEIFEDLEIPTLESTCPDDVEVVVPLGSTSAAVTWTPPSWTDNECVVTIDESHSSGFVISIPDGDISASINVTYTAYDRAGNPSENCSFTATASYCPIGWEYNAEFSSCYWVHTTTGSFADARTTCQSEAGGDLAVISNQEENSWILTKLTTDRLGWGAAWIGYDDISSEGQFEWAEQTAREGSLYEIIILGITLALFLSLKSVKVIGCPDGWVFWLGHCYQYVDTLVTWSTAETACNDLHTSGYLVTIASEDENRIVGEEIGILNNAWIGYSDSSIEASFNWVPSGKCSNYSNFNENQPDNSGNEDCVEFEASSEKWNDLPCTDSRRYVCEIFEDNSIPSFGSSCPSDQSLVTDDGSLSIEVTWVEPTATDDECIDTVSANYNSSAIFSTSSTNTKEDTTVTYTATDISGNQATCSFVVSIISVCPDGWIYYERSCFLFLSSSYNYADAAEACRTEDENAELATIAGAEENTWIVDQLNNEGVSWSSGAWIGYDDIDVEGTFVWVNRLFEEVSEYTNWNSGNPDNYNSIEDCVELLTNENWNDQDCSANRAAVCEKVVRCPSGWVLWRGNCYKYIDTQKTWEDAKNACEADESTSNLLMISSTEENSMVLNLLGLSESSWIGYSDISSEGTFEWVEGDECPSYENWNNNEPSDSGGNEDCAEILSSNGVWNDGACTLQKHYICEIYEDKENPSFNSTCPSNVLQYTHLAYDYVNLEYTPPIPSDNQCVVTFEGNYSPGDEVYTGGAEFIDVSVVYTAVDRAGNQNTCSFNIHIRECPDGWELWERSCYKFDDTARSFAESRIACQAEEDADVVVIGGVIENNYIKLRMDELYPGWSSAWIGYSDETSEGTFEWLPNTVEISYYNNFGQSQPDNSNNEDCVEIGSVGTWNDNNCGTSLPVVCEKVVKCPESWTLWQRSCYFHHSVEETWSAANSSCQNYHPESTLAVISSSDENNLIRNALGVSTQVWIGYSDLDTEGTFEWLDNGECSNFTVWNSGEPNGGTSENCVDQETNSNWNDLNCDSTIGAVCEMFVDSEIPKFTNCPSNQDVNTDAGEDYATLTWSVPVDSDNQCVISVVSDYNPGDQLPLNFGLENTISNTYTAMDKSGNIGTCTFSITVRDSESPVYDACPLSMSLNTDAGESFATVTWTIPSFIDNSDETVNVTASHTPSIQVELDSGLTDTVTVTYDAVDPAGNALQCAFNITVSDTENPVITGCPSNANFDTDAGQAFATVTWTIPSFTDNSDETVNVTASHTPSIQVELDSGLTDTVTVTYDAVDPAGNALQCAFNITVADTENPVITGCPSNANFDTDAGQAYATTTWTEPTYSDNSGLSTAASSQSPGYQLSVSAGLEASESITYTLTDPSGNFDTCTFTITVTDNESPTVSGCPASQNLSTAAAQDYQVFIWTTPTFIDNSGETPAVTESHASGVTVSLSSGMPTTQEVVYEATDPSGNTEQCTFTLRVSDTESPTFVNCPSNIIQDTDGSLNYATVTWTEPTFSDNSGLTPAVVPTHTPPIQVSLSNGLQTTTTVSYVGTDVAGNSVECTFDVTVSDAESPVYDACPLSITPDTDPGESFATVTWIIPSFTDNSDETVNVTASHTPSIQVELNGGLTDTVIVTYDAVDPAGNTEQCTFNITVSDVENPEYDACPSDMVLDTEPSEWYSTAIWMVPAFTDNSDEIVAVTASHTSPYQATLDNGLSTTITVTYEGLDPSLNSRICSFTITVNDNETPVYDICPDDQYLTIGYNMDYVIVNWTEPVYIDNSGLVNVTSTHEPYTRFYDNADVVYTGTDPSGNVNITCTFYIEVTDKQAPSFTNCPNDTEANTLPGTKLQVITWDELTVTDNVDPNPVITALSIHTSGDAYFIGPGYEIMYKVVDETGNIGYCNFTILIIDAEPPIWSDCPVNITINAEQGLATAHALWTEPSVTDNSDIIASQDQSHEPGEQFNFGETSVIYTASDGSGNVGNCSFIVEILDDQLPSFGDTCPSNITIDTEPDENYALVNWTAPSVTDNVAVDTLISTHTPVEQIMFVSGQSTEVIYTATDTSGNTIDCVFIINVEDNEPPHFAGCPSDTDLPTDPSSATGTSVWSPPSARDNVGVDHLLTTASHTPGSQFLIGGTTITYRSFDTSSNEGVCTFVVTIYEPAGFINIDNQPPIIINCPSDQSTETDPGASVSTFTWIPPVATDNVGVESFVESNGPGTEFNIGVTNVTYIATDAALLESVCSFTIEVIDNEPPIITCPEDISQSTDPGQPSTAVTWPEVAATDNSGSATINSFGHSSVSGDTFSIGNVTLTYEASDSSGNTASCSFVIAVVDDEPPQINDASEDITMSTDPGISTAVITWMEPTAIDNSNTTVNLETDVASGSTFDIGITTVTYTATDVNNNVFIHTFTITITDDEPPTINNGPLDITSSTDQGEPDTTISWTEPTATDNSGNVTLTSNHSPNTIFPIGNTTIVYTASDTFGNSDTYAFVVVVEDNEDPVISCPVLPATISTDAGENFASVIVPSATATDNSNSVSLTSTGVQMEYNFQFPAVPYTIAITASDPYGNSATCSFNITITDEEAPTAMCPNNITTSTDSNQPSAVVIWTVSASDNSDMAVSVVEDGHSFSSGDALPIGENVLTYLATDVSGNSITCTFMIMVNDNEDPIISDCPVNVMVDISADSNVATATWTEPTATDNSGSAIINSDYESGDSFSVGSTVVTYMASDPSSNTAECLITVEVSDNIPPDFDGTCPENITVNNENENAGAVVTWTVPTPIDNSGVVSSFVSTHLPESFFEIGGVLVTYTATDPSENINTCSFTIIVQDIEPPTVSDCPSDIVVQTSPNSNTGYVDWTEPTATDNSGVVTLTSTDGYGNFDIGTVAVSYVAVDAASPPNVQTCTFEVTVQDDEPPVLANIPSDIVHFAEINEDSTIITWDNPTASDNSGSTAVTSTHSPGDSFGIGETTVTYTATDDSGNSLEESFTITIYEHDTTPPEFVNPPSDVVANADPGSDSTTVIWSAPSITDNVGVMNITVSHSSGESFSIGTTTVTYTAVDLAGNVASSSFTITIEDNESPELSNLPEDQILTSDTDSATAVATWTTPTATDNSGVVALTSDHSSGDVFEVGTTTVTYTATDGSNNVQSYSFAVTVTDNQNPIIHDCPGDITTFTDDESSVAVIEWDVPTAVDNHEIEYLTASTPPGTEFNVGMTLVTYTAADITGNFVNCEFTVTVTDVQPPWFQSCPTEAIVQTVPIGSGTVPVLLPDPMAVDNVAVNGTTTTHTSGEDFPIGITTVTVTAVDDAGNSAHCTFTVEVEDTENPVFIECPLNIQQSTDTGSNDAVVSWTEPQATDNSGDPTVTQSHQPGFVFPIGVTSVVYSAVDADSNIATCSFSVQISDDEAPVFSFTPESQTQDTSEGSSTAVVTWDDAEATDNSGTDPTVTVDIPSGSTFQIGNTTVTYRAVDSEGNEIQFSFVITVTDNEAPVIANMPDDVELTTDVGDSMASYSWITPTITDNSGSVSTMITKTSPSSFPIGTTVVWYNATDPSGNTFKQHFTVVVVDTEGPEIVSSTGDATASTDPGSASSAVYWTPPSFTDNAGDLTVTSSHEPGASFPIGITTVTYTAEDTAGNIASVSFDVIVEDNEAPVFQDIPDDVTIVLDTGETSASASWAAPLVSDNSDSYNVSSSHDPDTTFPIGETVVTYTATDASGNSNTISFVVDILDEQSPEITCPDGISVPTDKGMSTAVATWVEPEATDNTGTPTVTSSSSSGSNFTLGITPVLYTATDNSGNIATCSFYVFVQDLEAPTVENLPGDVDTVAEPGGNIATVEWETPIASDNAGSVAVVQSHESPAEFPIGDTVVTYTFTDEASNSFVYQFTVSVADDQDPMFTSIPTAISASADKGSSGTVVQWSTPTAEDNSGSVVVTTTPLSGSVFPIGTTDVVVTAADGDGNIVVETFSVTVTDEEYPSFPNCPSAIDLEISSGTSVNVTWTEPVANDNHGIKSLTSNYVPGDSFGTGTTTVIYNATDLSGNFALCQFPVTILDTGLPVFNDCHENITRCTDTGEITGIVTWTEPTAQDSLNSVVVTSNLQPGVSLPVGENKIVYAATDAAGNTATCTFYAVVNDCESPTLSSIPNDISVDSDPGSSSVVVSWSSPTATDNSGVQPTLTASIQPGSVFQIGTTEVVYTATDMDGNSDQISFFVTVVDREGPLLEGCSSDIQSASPVVNWATPSALDNSGDVTITSTHSPGDTFEDGTTEVVYTVTDGSGNSAQCQFSVTVIDTSVPIFRNCSTPIQVSTDTGQPTAIVTWSDPVVIDQSGVTLTQTVQSGTAFDVGVHTVTYYAVNSNEAQSNCTFTVTVVEEFVDIDPPVITGCPSDVVVTASLGETSTAVTWTPPTASDNSGTPVVVPSHNPGDTFEAGSTAVIYTAIDSSGNHDTCSFTVNVMIETDSETPTFTSFPTNIERIVAPGTSSVVVTWNIPVATDNAGSPTLASQYTPGQSFTEGMTVVIYTATDSSGNTATDMFTITIIVDDSPPTIINSPDDIVATVDLGVTSTSVTWDEPTASDESGAVTQVGPNFQPGSVFSLGTSLVSYTFVDQFGNTAISQFSITVQSEEDTEPPFIYGCSGDISAILPSGADSVTVSWTTPTATDNSGFFTSESNYAPGDSFTKGTTAIEYIFRDDTGNQAMCNFNIFVTDLISLTCPLDQTDIVTTSSSSSVTVVTWTEPTIDESSGFTLSSTYNSGALFAVGTTVVTYTAVDSLNNVVSCSFSVTVMEHDTTPPVITNLPTDIVTSTIPGRATASVTWNIPSVSDNSNSYQLIGNYDPPTEFEVGTTQVTYTATDDAGNRATASFLVTVQDTERPAISNCPSSKISYVLDSSSTALLHWDEPTATDNVGNVTMVSNISPGDRLSPGQYIVTYTATDQSGNTATCSFTLTISLATYTDEILASTTFDIIRGENGNFSEAQAATLMSLLEDDIEDVIRQSEFSSSVVGVTVNGYSFDNVNNPVVNYTIYFDDGSTVTEPGVEALLNAALLNGVLPTGNTVQDGAFYIGIGECADVTCENGGKCNRVTDGYECQCTSGWTGNLCQTDLNECTSSSICSSDLVCKNTFGGYLCGCEPGFHLKNSVCVLSKEITGEFAIAEIGDATAIFTEPYLNADSDEYLDLEAKVIETLTKIFKDLPGFVSVYVFQFSSGSIKVQYVVQFDYESNTTAPNVNDIFSENVANDGMLSDSILDLEPESYQVIEEICVPGYCSNGGECSINTDTYVSMCICPDIYTGDRCDEIVKVVAGNTFQIIGIVLGSLAAVIFVFLIVAGFCCWLLGARRRRRKGALYDDDDHRIIRTLTTPIDSPALKPVFYPPPIADKTYDLREESNLGGNLDDVRTRSLRDDSGFLNPYVATGYINKAHSFMNNFDDDRSSNDDSDIQNNHHMY
ncbi:mucin-12-like [Anneissia japonica]|uniref:mucin-12-like n=1 Tax=Anneissia japonica TaxID=1529436 RepID=UPI00142593C5|nr:mucin-12-like [Anneissia japonica]